MRGYLLREYLDAEERVEEEEYEELGPPACDECGAELEELYEGMVICEVCGKHFPKRG